MPRAPKKIKRRAVRPLIPIDWEKVDFWMKAGCSGVEIAGILGCCHHTFYARYEQEHGVTFSTARPMKKEGGAGMIRAKQFHCALQGNNRMLEILGEELLGQGKKKQDSPNDEILNKILESAKSQGESISKSQEENATISETSSECISSDTSI